MSADPRYQAPPEALKRSLGLVDVAAIGLNGVIGTGIFFLPGTIAAELGPASLVTFLVSVALCTLIVLCFAEVGSRFDNTGGPVLYSHAAFGETAGFLVGWITWVIRVVAWGALANGLVSALTALAPGAQGYRELIITGLIVVLTAVNIVGVTPGALVTNFFTAAKLLPIAFFVGIGVFHLDSELFTPFAPHGFGEIAPATLVILYAFVGFEVLTVPAGEMRNPKRSVPRALILVMALVTVVYLLIWLVCTGTYPELAGSMNPVAEAAARFMGARGGTLVAIGILLSVVGINAGSALVAPRCLYALSHEGYLPRWIGYVYPRTQTPVVAIAVSSIVTLVVALSGSYVELAVISVVARFAQYIPTCLAVLYFRARGPEAAAGFRVPGGPAVPVLAVALCAWLLLESEPDKLLWGLVGLTSGLLLYLPVRVSRPKEENR
jgi:amino acid transporter